MVNISALKTRENSGYGPATVNTTSGDLLFEIKHVKLIYVVYSVHLYS
jgi:hypothetical protein